jgi:nucleoside-diphosphate-sugar epimerase
MNRRVLVTGARGFTGKYVWEQLKRDGYEPVALTEDLTCDSGSVDLRDFEAVSRCVSAARADYCIHLAGISYVGHGSPNDFYEVNLCGTRNLLQCLEKKNMRKVVISSSANVYGNTSETITENTPVNPVNDYAVSKLSMEYMARLFMDRLPITIVRPFNYTGVGQSKDFLVPKIVSAFRDREELVLGNLDVARDFSDVRYVATVYSSLLSSIFVGETLNICSGHTNSLLEIVDMLCHMTGYKPKITSSQKLQRKQEISTVSCNPTKVISLFPSLHRYSFAQTLEWMLKAN